MSSTTNSQLLNERIRWKLENSDITQKRFHGEYLRKGNNWIDVFKKGNGEEEAVRGVNANAEGVAR